MALFPPSWPEMLLNKYKRHYPEREGPPYGVGMFSDEVPPPFDPQWYQENVVQPHSVEGKKKPFGNIPLAWSMARGGLMDAKHQNPGMEAAMGSTFHPTYQGSMLAELPQTELLPGYMGERPNPAQLDLSDPENAYSGMGQEAFDATRPPQGQPQQGQPQQGGLMSKLGGLFGGGPQNINLALLQAGLGTMAAGGWQKMPVTLGQAIGQGSIPAIGTHLEIQEQKRRDELAGAQIEQMQMLRQAQSDELKAKTAERQRMAGLLQAYQAAGTQEEKVAILQQMYPDEAFKAQLKGAEPYTLGQGDARFQGGKQVAVNPREGEFAKIARDAGLSPGTPAYDKARADWLKKQTQFAPPIAQMNVQAYKPANETLQEEFAKELRQSYNALKSAPSTLANIERAKAAALKASPFLGSGGDVKREIAKFFNNNLGTSINPEAVASAEELNSRLFQQILDNLKKLDAQPSQMQQAAMQEAMGKLTTDPQALPQVLNVFAEIIREKVSLHNKDAQQAVNKGLTFMYDPIINLDERPAQGVPWANDPKGPWRK
jgi:hypothetical protein